MYERILVAFDGSRPSRRALDEAIGLARDQNAQLRIVHVVAATGGFVAGGMGTARYADAPTASWGDARALVREAEERARAQSVATESALIEARDRIGATVIADAVEWSADLIVVGTHGRTGLRSLLAGSIAESVVRASPVAVLLVRLAAEDRPRRPRGGKRVRIGPVIRDVATVPAQTPSI